MKIEEISEVQSKYKLSYSEKYGRYLVAAKRLSPGEVIIRDTPVAIGPAVFNKNPLCFGCMRVIPHVDIIDYKNSCSICEIANFCSPSCEEKKTHHTLEECQLFKSKNTKKALSLLSFQEIKSFLFLLRLYLVKERDPTCWDNILKLEGHLEARRGTKVWLERQENVIEVLKRYKLIDEDTEILQKLCGILDVNSFELRSPGTLDESPLRGLYCEASLMAHDCRGNTHLTVDDDFQLTVFASCPIEPGQAILFHYTSALLGVVDRREYLREGKYFECQCDLCLDPAELGSNLSSIKCPRCKKGLIQLKKLTKDPYVKDKIWQCSKCLNLFSGSLVKSTIDFANEKISGLKNGSTSRDLEDLMKNLGFNFHSNHFIMVNLKQKLLMFYRNELTALNPARKILKRMLELYGEILEVQEIVEPGISRLKGIILYEMHLPMEILADRDYMSGEISSEELANRLQEAVNLLKRSLSMLLLEPATNPEGLLAKNALEQFKNLRDKIEDVRALSFAGNSSKHLFDKKIKRRNK